MKNAEMKVVRFGGSGVIATSALRMSGLYDRTDNNATFGGKSLDNYSSTYFYRAEGIRSLGSGLKEYEEDWTVEDFNGLYEFRAASEVGDDKVGWYKISQ